MASRSPHPAAPVDPEADRLLRALATQRAARTTTVQGRAAIDDLIAEITARLAHRKDVDRAAA